MSKEIERLRKNALEASEKREELKEQQTINSDDLSVLEDLLGIPLEDSSSLSQIESLSETVDAEKCLIDENVATNEKDIDEALEDIDDYIASYEKSIEKYEKMIKATDLIDLHPEISNAESSIEELEGIRKILDEDSSARLSGHDSDSVAILEAANEGADLQNDNRSEDNKVERPQSCAENERDAIAQVLSKQSGLHGTYKVQITDKLHNGTEIARKVFLKCVPENSVADCAYDGVPHYSTSDRRVKMNFDSDSNNCRGSGTTFFHEHGHLIDMSGGTAISDNPAFRNALQKDFEAYIMDYMEANHSSIIDTYAHISESDELWSDSHSAVSDLFGALSYGLAQGKWGHDRVYWESDLTNLTSEAFAHFFEAQFDLNRLQILSSYFPTAAKEFKYLLEQSIASDNYMHRNTTNTAQRNLHGEIAIGNNRHMTSADAERCSHAELFRNALGNLAYKAAQWVGENPLQAGDSLGQYAGTAAFSLRRELGRVLYHGSAATMEGQPNPGAELNNTEITQAIKAGAESSGRTKPVKPLADGKPLYDGKTGIELTADEWRGFETVDAVRAKKAGGSK